MTAYNVTFYLDSDQEDELEKLVNIASHIGWKTNKEAMFSMLVKVDSKESINEKIDFYKSVFSKLAKS